MRGVQCGTTEPPTALGEMVLSPPCNTEASDLPLPVGAAEGPPSSGPCPLCLEQSPPPEPVRSGSCVPFCWSVSSSPPGSPCSVRLFTCLLCSSHSGLPAAPQTHQPGPCLRPFALAVPAAWVILSLVSHGSFPPFVWVSAGRPMAEAFPGYCVQIAPPPHVCLLSCLIFFKRYLR